MDIAEQIRKHLPRDAEKTIPEIDEYCKYYKELFCDVRNYGRAANKRGIVI